MSNGDRVKFGKDDEIEEMFSSRYGFNKMPEKVLRVVKDYPFWLVYYGKNVHLTENEEPFMGY
jgi:hypothetical protein